MTHDPAALASALGAASALPALAAMARVACIDVRTLEIDPDWTAFAGWTGLAAIVLAEGPAAWPGAVAAAALAGGAAWLLARLRPGAMGRGDAGLLALAGLAAGPDLLAPAMALAAALAAAAAAAYGLARGKRAGRILRAHMVPIAPPFMAASAPVLAWRVADGAWPGAVPQGHAAAALVALAGTLALGGALAAGALPMARRRRRASCRAAKREEA